MTESSINCTTHFKLCLHQNEALVNMCMELTLMWWIQLRWASAVCIDVQHQGNAHWGLTQSVKNQFNCWIAMLLEWRTWNNDPGLHRLIFELNKICNGAVYSLYTDPWHLNYLLLCFLRGVANYNPVIHSTIYIAANPRMPLGLKTWNMDICWIYTVSLCEGNSSDHNSWCDALI